MIHVKTFLLFNIVCGGVLMFAAHPEVARVIAIGAYFWAAAMYISPFLCDMLGIDKDGNGAIAAYIFIGAPLVAGFAAAAFGIPSIFN